MVNIVLKRVYDDYDDGDGFRVLVDRLWPRGIKKEYLHHNLWAKEITPSTVLRKKFHENLKDNWSAFVSDYRNELFNSKNVDNFISLIKDKPKVTLLYASKNKEQNHAIILKDFLDDKLKHET